GKVISGGALNVAASATARQVAAAFNSVSDETGVTADASTTATLSGVTHVGAVNFQLFGSNKQAVTIASTVTNLQDLSSVAQAINAKSSLTGVTAVADKSGNVVLTELDGDDIGIKNQGVAGAGLDGASFRGADTKTAAGITSQGVAVTLGDVTSA